VTKEGWRRGDRAGERPRVGYDAAAVLASDDRTAMTSACLDRLAPSSTHPCRVFDRQRNTESAGHVDRPDESRSFATGKDLAARTENETEAGKERNYPGTLLLSPDTAGKYAELPNERKDTALGTRALDLALAWTKHPTCTRCVDPEMRSSLASASNSA